MGRRKRIIFVTGTDTGVGKTIFTGLFLRTLRGTGIDAVGLKPFCSGSREDVRFLQRFQTGLLPDKVVNPVFISKPVAPYVEFRKQKISAKEIVEKIQGVEHEVLLVEGSGGVLVPLSQNFLVRDLIRELRAEVILVSRNRLGTINHTLLSVEALKKFRPSVILMDQGKADESSKTNLRLLRELLPGTMVEAFPFLGRDVLKLNRRAEGLFQKFF